MHNALITLLDSKDFEYITIKEICETAGVNRSTFYLHYDNINDLLQETVEAVYKDFFGRFGAEGGAAICIVNYPLYKGLLKKGKDKYAFEILELAKEITGEL